MQVRAWAVNRISDSATNFLTVTYQNDTVNGQAYPLSIDYTGNTAAGKPPYNHVRFSYDGPRGDITPAYQTGSLMQTTMLLTNIKTYVGTSTTPVYDYRLGYTPGTATTHSLLTSVKLCDASGACLPQTTFDWQGSEDTLTLTAVPNGIAQGRRVHYPNGSFYRSPALISPDFNGDGLSDVLIDTAYGDTCPSTGAVYLGTAASTFVTANATVNYTVPMPPYYVNGPLCTYIYNGSGPLLIDIDSNGLSDISAIQVGGSSANQYLLNNGSGTNFSQTNRR
ncbi:MAG: hypothetical protein WDM81_11660 [Rhizomicrobium sp.]